MKCSLLCLCLAAASGLQLGGSPTLRRPRALALRMQEEPQGEVPVGIREVPVEGAAAPAADTAGNVYDDVAPPPPRDPLSNTMKERLIRESAGLGADPNQKNPFLPVFFGVGVFVLLGALAVNM